MSGVSPVPTGVTGARYGVVVRGAHSWHARHCSWASGRTSQRLGSRLLIGTRPGGQTHGLLVRTPADGSGRPGMAEGRWGGCGMCLPGGKGPRSVPTPGAPCPRSAPSGLHVHEPCPSTCVFGLVQNPLATLSVGLHLNTPFLLPSRPCVSVDREHRGPSGQLHPRVALGLGAREEPAVSSSQQPGLWAEMVAVSCPACPPHRGQAAPLLTLYLEMTQHPTEPPPVPLGAGPALSLRCQPGTAAALGQGPFLGQGQVVFPHLGKREVKTREGSGLPQAGRASPGQEVTVGRGARAGERGRPVASLGSRASGASSEEYRAPAHPVARTLDARGSRSGPQDSTSGHPQGSTPVSCPFTPRLHQA